MADRRMLSKRIVESARFLRIPITAQMLYFHLVLNADDDGIVEAFPIMRMVGCSEEDINTLSEKGFIRILNEDMVSHIVDWEESNHVRADRKTDSIYKHLLLQHDSEQEVSNINTADTCQPNGNQMTTKCQPNANQVPTKCQHRVGKDSIGKDSIGEYRVEEDNTRTREDSPTTVPDEVLRAYQDNIQPIATAMELEKLIYDVEKYGSNIVIKAIQRAVMRNKRSLGYVEGILTDWEKNGYDEERGIHGKTGRDFKQDDDDSWAEQFAHLGANDTG